MLMFLNAILEEGTGILAFEPYMCYVWLGVFVIAVIVELLTSELVSVWFAGGALLALIVSFIPNAPFWAEILVFAICSLLLVLFLRPFAKKKMMKKVPESRFNVDDMVGRKAKVTKRITDLDRGEIRYHDVIWTAESQDGETIEEGEIVEIVAIVGNKVIVKKNVVTNKEE